MDGITLTVTPWWALAGCVGALIGSIVATYRYEIHSRSFNVATIGLGISGIASILCFAWAINYSAITSFNEKIDSMGQWTVLYRSVDEQHPAIQDMNIQAFLSENANLELMTGDQFKMLMWTTNGIGADDLIGFVAPPAKEEVSTEAEEEVETK